MTRHISLRRRGGTEDKNWNQVCQDTFKTLLWLLPVITFLWIFCTLWICYALAVAYDDAEAGFPTISMVSKEAPERGIFSQLINIGSVLLALSAFVRYIFLKAADRWDKTNKFGLFMGLVTALGIGMSANFESGYHDVMHVVGAGMGFVTGTFYCWIQVFLSYKILISAKCGKCTFVTQLVISCLVTALLITFIAITAYLEDPLWERLAIRRPFNELDRGVVYLVWSITEWFMVILQLVFMLTYAQNFWNWQVKVTVDGHLDDLYKGSRISPHGAAYSDSQIPEYGGRVNPAMEM